jgi:putative FmdB family regulatory protein
MPLYDVKCLKCGHEAEIVVHIEDRDKSICMNCGGPTKSLCSTSKKDWFRLHINEDFDGTPIEVRSKRHLKELCKQHGVYSRAL